MPNREEGFLLSIRGKSKRKDTAQLEKKNNVEEGALEKIQRGKKREGGTAGVAAGKGDSSKRKGRKKGRFPYGKGCPWGFFLRKYKTISNMQKSELAEKGKAGSQGGIGWGKGRWGKANCAKKRRQA